MGTKWSQEAKERFRKRLARRQQEYSERESNTATLEPLVPEPEESRKFLPFNAPAIGVAEEALVLKVLRSGWIGSGPIAKMFETEFSKFLGEGYAIAVSSCTDALLIALKVLGIGTGTEVITTPLTFAATINAILLAGAMPRFVDVDPSGNLDAEKVRFQITNKSKALMPVHLYGACCDMARLSVATKSFDLKLVDDCAHGFGGFYHGPDYKKPIGTLADISCFSFYANKNVTSAEGGMIVTKRADWSERMRAISMQGLNYSSWNRYGNGSPKDYEVLHEGIKGSMSDVHAAIGLSQLRRWPELKAKRAKVWAIYEQYFGPKEPGHSQSIFTIRVRNRTQFRQKLFEEGIGTGVHYRPLHLEPGYKFLGYKEGDLPMAEKIGAETVSLPVSATMTEEDAHYVVNTASRYMEGV